MTRRDTDNPAAIYRDSHHPSDELEPGWDFAGMVDDARFGFLAGLLVTEADALPTWNPGDEFEASRQEALAALE